MISNAICDLGRVVANASCACLVVLLSQGTHDGRPRYVERNKENWGAFKQEVIPAEIVYCGMIGMWVFRHQHIRTSLDSDSEVKSYFVLFSSPRPVVVFDITNLLSSCYCRIRALG